MVASTATRSGSSSSWTSARPTAGGWTTSYPRERSSSGSARCGRSSRSTRRTPARSPGAIASVSQPFCQTCTRSRLSALGELYTCLFATRGHDLRALVRGGASDDELEAALRGIWGRRTDRYSELRTEATTVRDKVEMSYIGG